MPSNKINILIVDDDEVYLKYFEKYINDFNERINVIKSSDGLDASFKLKNQDFDAIILDLQLPKVEGVKLLDQIKLKENLVICAGEISKKHVAELVQQKIRNVIKKPFTIEDLDCRFKPILEKITA